MTRRFPDFSRPAAPPWRWSDTFLVALCSSIAVAPMAFTLFVGLLIKPAGAHTAVSGWSYPASCCADYDCAEISPSRVKEAPGGYIVDGHFSVPHSEVKQSPDGHFHACFPNPEMLRCLFIPPSGS